MRIISSAGHDPGMPGFETCPGTEVFPDRGERGYGLLIMTSKQLIANRPYHQKCRTGLVFPGRSNVRDNGPSTSSVILPAPPPSSV